MMIGKIKLTRDQAKAIADLLQVSKGDIAGILDDHARGEWTLREWLPLNGLSMSDMARALLIGYEVEEGESDGL